MTKRWISRSLLLAAVVMTSATCTSLPETPRRGADAGNGDAPGTDGGPVAIDAKPANGDGGAREAIGGIDVAAVLDGAAADLALPTVDTAAEADTADALELAEDVVSQEDAPLGMDPDTALVGMEPDVPALDMEPDSATLDLVGLDSSGLLPAALDATAEDSSVVIPCGPRDCRSSVDHNCNGVPDNSEPECDCPIANQSATCQAAAQSGICSVGTKLCTFSLDNTTSAWSACLPGSPRSRDCTSTADNNCDGTPDSSETACACQPTATKSCSTGLSGICATGTSTCVVAADRTSSQWGTCVAPSPRTRDCTSTNDNNCNGTPDKSEAACADCGQTAPRVCNAHPGLDGIGICTAGTQVVVMAADKSECHWGPCTGDQGPTTGELCGVDALDLNCDGIRGNGNCVKTLTIFSQWVSITCGCSDLRSYNTYSAGDGASGSEVSQFKVFTAPRPANTAAVCNNGGSVTIGGSCSTPLGYVSTVRGSGYVPLSYTSSTMPCGAMTSYGTPVAPGKTSTTLNYYVIP